MIANNGPLAVRQVKRTVLESLGVSLDRAYEMEDAARAKIMSTEDAVEGPKAFVQRRKPNFVGR